MAAFLRRGHGLFLDRHADAGAPVEDFLRGSVRAVHEKEGIKTVIKICLSGQRNIPVTDDRGSGFLGMISSRNVLDYLGGGRMHQVFAMAKDYSKVTAARIMETGHVTLDRKDPASRALEIFKQTEEEALPLLNRGRLEGMVTERDIATGLSRKSGVRSWEIMTTKPIVCRESHPVSEVAGMLVRGGYSRLPVLREGFITGIVTPHDIISYLDREKKVMSLRKDRSSLSGAMNSMIVTASPSDDVSEVAREMERNNAGMIPVVEDYQVQGVITYRDIIEAM